MRSLYTAGIFFYTLGIRITSLWNEKAGKWVKGRKNWRSSLNNAIQKNDSWVWFHCASLGEFEQGRPVIEAIRDKYPTFRVLLTFFSPSGYEIRKNYKGADHVTYLPADFPGNARTILQIVKPKAVFFVKYDLWVNVLLEIKKQNIPNFLISAKLNENSGFFRPPFAGLFKLAFRSFSHIFTQDDLTAMLLKEFCSHPNVTIAGDTRFDRVAALPKTAEPVPEVEKFTAGKFTIIAGSVWPEDEKLIFQAMELLNDLPLKWIIAPHEIDPNRIEKRIQANPEKEIRFSKIDQIKKNHHILWIDNIGMLSRLYRHSDVVFIGGGFGKGIHNTQEPATFGNPVAFGTEYHRFEEAVELVKKELFRPLTSPEELKSFIQEYFDDPKMLKRDRQAIAEYVRQRAGATQRVMEVLAELEWKG